MTDTAFRIDARWPCPPAENERDAAHLSLRLGDQVVTRLAIIDRHEVRDYFRASAVTLALWLTDHWWRLRWETLKDQRRPSADWRLRHELTSAPGGTLWPPFMMYGTGERVVTGPTFGSTAHAGPIRYLDPDIVRSVPGDAYEAGLDRFFDAVLQVCARAQDGVNLSHLLEELRAERSDPDAAAWRILEARLGFDPDEAPDSLMDRLAASSSEYGVEAVDEAVDAVPGLEAAAAFERAIEAATSSPVVVDTVIIERMDVPLTDRASQPWRAAERAASALRRSIGLEHGFFSNEALAETLGASWTTLKSAPPTARNLPYGARLKVGAGRTGIALQTKAVVDRRFELARITGDVAWARQSGFGVVSRSRTERQKFQRAFAQSLLCPFSEVQRWVDLADPSDGQIADSAKRFGVSLHVVRTLLVNKGALPRDTLQDRLDAA